MTAAAKTTVTHPDNTVSKRSSVRATYTHAVVVGPVNAEVRAAYLSRQADLHLTKAATLRAALAKAETRLVDRRLGSRRTPLTPADSSYYHTHELVLVGSSIGTNRKAMVMWPLNVRSSVDGRTQDYGPGYDREVGAKIVDARDNLLDLARRTAEGHEESADSLRAEAAALRSGATKPAQGYEVVRWSSREDLAIKAAAGEFAGFAERGHSVTVVPVD